MAGCATLPTASRTGAVHEITITDVLSPQDLEVEPGDEVRWVNRRPDPVWIYFTEHASRELSCKRGFSYFSGPEERAKIKPNESASLCFTRPETVGFSVQVAPAVEGGATLGALSEPPSVPGAIIVKQPSARKAPGVSPSPMIK
jgi:plastocyanin